MQAIRLSSNRYIGAHLHVSHTLFFPFLISLLLSATQVITSYRFSNGHGSPTWTQFQCVGNESRLEDCYYNTGVCQGYNTYTANFAIVGLKCEGDVIPPSNLFFLLFASFLMHIIYALKHSFEVSFFLSGFLQIIVLRIL